MANTTIIIRKTAGPENPLTSACVPSVKQTLGFLFNEAHKASKTYSALHEPSYNLPFIVKEGTLVI